MLLVNHSGITTLGVIKKIETILHTKIGTPKIGILGGSEKPSEEEVYEIQVSCVIQWEIPMQNKKCL